MYQDEERTVIEEILDNKRAVEKLEQGYHYDDVKLVLLVAGIIALIIIVVHFVLTGSLAW